MRDQMARVQIDHPPEGPVFRRPWHDGGRVRQEQLERRVLTLEAELDSVRAEVGALVKVARGMCAGLLAATEPTSGGQ